MKNTYHSSAAKIALCGVLAALAVVIMILCGVIQIGTYLGPIVASVVLIPILYEYGTGTSVMLYLVIAVLSLLLSPDKESAFFFLFLGWYPIARPALTRIRPKALSITTKLIIFIAATAAAYAVMLFLVGIESVTEEASTFTLGFFAVLCILGCITFLLCDVVYGRLSVMYANKWHDKLWKGH